MSPDPLTVIAEGERLLAAYEDVMSTPGPIMGLAASQAGHDLRDWLHGNAAALLAVARAAADAAKWMRDPRIGNWTYMEDSAFYADLESHRDYITAALQSLTETDHG